MSNLQTQKVHAIFVGNELDSLFYTDEAGQDLRDNRLSILKDMGKSFGDTRHVEWRLTTLYGEPPDESE